MRVSALTGVAALLAAAACQPNTSRPPFAPLLEAAGTEVRLPVKDATRYLADALRNDSIPIRRVVPRDGYLESPWFNSNSKRPIKGHRPLGLDVVRVRAWADPSRPGNTSSRWKPRIECWRIRLYRSGSWTGRYRSIIRLG